MPWPWPFGHYNPPPSDNDREGGASPPKPPLSSSASTPSPQPSTWTPPPSPNSWTTSLNKTDYAHYTTPQTLLFGFLTSATTLALVSLYKTRLRRIPGAAYLEPGFFRRKSLWGYVSSVGDGDNFRLWHAPGGRAMGWGWLRRVGPQAGGKAGSGKVGWWRFWARGGGKGGKGQETLHIRLAGVDAPECAHFGRPAQPFSQEALEWLRGEVGGKWVRAYPLRPDQYGRVVCTVWKRRWGGVLGRRDVGEEMLRRGWATIYEAKFGSEFGGREGVYKEAEAKARKRGVGMWAQPGLVGRMLGRTGGSKESPREYKTRMKELEEKAAREQKEEVVNAGSGQKKAEKRGE